MASRERGEGMSCPICGCTTEGPGIDGFARCQGCGDAVIPKISGALTCPCPICTGTAEGPELEGDEPTPEDWQDAAGDLHFHEAKEEGRDDSWAV